MFRIVLLISLFAVGALAAQGERPNIVIFYTDDQNRDQFGFNDGWPTPNMDRLAAEGLVFKKFYVNTSLCAPSRVALQTGRYASASGAVLRAYPPDQIPFILQTLGDEENRPAEAWNLPTTLRDAGYATGIVGKFHLGFLGEREKTTGDTSLGDPEKMAKLRHNFELAQESAYAGGYTYAEALYHDNVQPDNFCRDVMKHNPEWIAWKAREFIEKESAEDNPFFLVVNPTLPHWPPAYAPDEKPFFDSLTSDPRITAVGLVEGIESGMPSRESVLERAEELRGLGIEGKYLPDVIWLDDMIGAVVQELADAGVKENTLVLVISDHGGFGKWTNRDHGINSAAMAYWPGRIPPGTVSSELVQNVDLAPTLFEIAGTEPAPDADLHGRSVAHHLLDPSQPSGREYVYSEIGFERAITRADGMKLLVDMAAPDSGRWNPKVGDPENPKVRLYDLTNDPGERRNLVDDPEYADELKELQGLLWKQSQQLPHAFGQYK